MVTKDTEHISLRKCHFLRRLLLVLLNPVIMVTTCNEHIRSILVTTCTEHSRPRIYNFLRIGDLAKKLFFGKIQIYMHIIGPENATF